MLGTVLGARVLQWAEQTNPLFTEAAAWGWDTQPRDVRAARCVRLGGTGHSTGRGGLLQEEGREG